LRVSVLIQVCLFINFLYFKPDTENNANFDTESNKRGNFDAVQQTFDQKFASV